MCTVTSVNSGKKMTSAADTQDNSMICAAVQNRMMVSRIHLVYHMLFVLTRLVSVVNTFNMFSNMGLHISADSPKRGSRANA